MRRGSKVITNQYVSNQCADGLSIQCLLLISDLLISDY